MSKAGTFAFFGTPRFAAAILKRLIENGLPPTLLVANPDQPIGRRKIITPPPTKQVVLDSGAPLMVFQPEKLDDAACKTLSGFDYFVVAAYAKILPKRVLELPRLGVIGTHPSLLPLFRGASPIQSVLLEGATETGTSLYVMDEKVDHGAVLAQKSLTDINLSILTYPELEKRLAELSAELLIETLPRFFTETLKGDPQDETKATFTKKFVSQDGFIEYETLLRAQNEGGDIAREIERKVRAFNPEPSVFTLSPSKGGLRRMKLLSTSLLPDGKLKLRQIQYEGKNPQNL